METFKRNDLVINVLLISGSIIFSLIKLDYTFIYCYFTVGGWQVISMLIHTTKGWFTRRKSKRYYYHWIVSITITIGLLTFAIPYFFILYYIMLFAAPIMAIFYTIMCYEEMKEIKQRHLLALK
jgi:hypothetical protein